MEPIKTEIVVIGAGPGGYAAAFYAADLGKRVVLVDREQQLGGVCLHRGCIPSKALLNATHQISAAKDSAQRGIVFAPPQIDLQKLRAWKDALLTKLAGGIAFLAQKRGVTVVRGQARFENSTTLTVETEAGAQAIQFEKCIIASGSKAALPKMFDLGDERVMTSRAALEVADIPARLLLVGGGSIGMELGTVYAALGSKVTLVEALEFCVAGADQDLVRPVMLFAKKNFSAVKLKTKITQLTATPEGIVAAMDAGGVVSEETFDRVLVAIGRVPNCDGLGLENTKVTRNERGFIVVSEKLQTSDENIFAIGDVVGGAMMAHKASREARVAVEAITGKSGGRPNFIVPAVVYTDPEIAWCGLTEAEAKAKNIPVAIAKFPWGASGRALTFDRADGLTKLVIDPATEKVLGVGIVGPGAGELIAEGVLAVELGATARDLTLCVHPHPTLSETVMESAEVFYGHATHTISKKLSEN
ncbi:MAG: lipoamide dehydrogenase, component is part of three enzyme complexe [Verrucomicrobiota bacterium]|jgi:dihydrolipoamide dehydrogenase